VVKQNEFDLTLAKIWHLGSKIIKTLFFVLKIHVVSQSRRIVAIQPKLDITVTNTSNRQRIKKSRFVFVIGTFSNQNSIIKLNILKCCGFEFVCYV